MLLRPSVWFPLPTSRSCRCAVLSTPLATTVQRARTWGCWVGEALLESAAARVCREVGGRVSVNVAVRDLDIGVPNEADARRLEVVVDGLPLSGAQLGVDTTLSVCGTGHLTLSVQTKMEQLWQLFRRRKEARYPELAGQHGRARLVVQRLVGVGQRSVANFSALLAKGKVRSEPKIMRPGPNKRGSSGWGSILACSSARAFAMSLLERPGGMGADGPTPSTDDVVWVARFRTLM